MSAVVFSDRRRCSWNRETDAFELGQATAKELVDVSNR